MIKMMNGVLAAGATLLIDHQTPLVIATGMGAELLCLHRPNILGDDDVPIEIHTVDIAF